jgi:hypothetical protein
MRLPIRDTCSQSSLWDHSGQVIQTDAKLRIDYDHTFAKVIYKKWIKKY